MTSMFPEKSPPAQKVDSNDVKQALNYRVMTCISSKKLYIMQIVFVRLHLFCKQGADLNRAHHSWGDWILANRICHARKSLIFST